MSILRQSELPFHKPRPEDAVGLFAPVWPSETAGRGRIVSNNRSTGAGQGKPSFKRKVHCRQCGFPADLNRDDNSGGSEDGNGGVGAITYTTSTITDRYGNTYTVASRDSAMRKGGGCPFCGSKNYSREGLEAVQGNEPK